MSEENKNENIEKVTSKKVMKKYKDGSRKLVRRYSDGREEVLEEYPPESTAPVKDEKTEAKAEVKAESNKEEKKEPENKAEEKPQKKEKLPDGAKKIMRKYKDGSKKLVLKYEDGREEILKVIPPEGGAAKAPARTAAVTAAQRVSTAPRADAPKRKRVSLDSQKARGGWLFVAPFIIGLVLIYLPIILDSIRFSFVTVSLNATGGGYSIAFAGLENYREALFVDAYFVQTLTTGITSLLMDIPAIVIFSLFMAVLLNEKMMGRAVFRAIFFIPVILSTGLIDRLDVNNTMMNYMQDTSKSIDTGSGTDVVNSVVTATDLKWMFESMKVGTGITEYIVSLMNNIYGIINRSGVQMLVYLAGLQSISPAIYESCQIDGASKWESFWKITIPMISPMILVNAVYTVIDALTSSSNSVMMYVEDVYNSNGTAGYVLSSAMSWLYFLAVIAIVAVVAAILSAFIFYQRRD